VEVVSNSTSSEELSTARRKESAVKVVTSSTAASSSAQSCIFSDSSWTADSVYLVLGRQLGLQEGDDGDMSVMMAIGRNPC
jgi:hypothetical protein